MKGSTEFKDKVEALCGEIEKSIIFSIVLEGFDVADQKFSHLINRLKHHVESYDYNETLTPDVEWALRDAAIALELPTARINYCNIEDVSRRHIIGLRDRLEDIESDKRLLSILLKLYQLAWGAVDREMLAEVA